MNQLQAMRIFSRVVDLRSFGLVAKQLGMSPAAVTRSVSMLEAHLNMRLLNRTTRNVSPTEEGQSYAAICKTITDQLDEVESALVRAPRDMGPVMIYGEVDKVTHLGGKIDAPRIRDRKLIVDGGITERLQNRKQTPAREVVAHEWRG